MLSHKFSKPLIISLLPALIWGLAACSGGSETPAEATVALEATTERPAESEAAATPATVAEPAANKTELISELREPATLAAAAQAIDLRELPTLDVIAQMGESEIGYLSYQTSEKMPAVLEFYRPHLAELGWQEIPEQEYIGESTAQFFFSKEDFILYLGANQMEGMAMVTLINHGNIDVRALPVYPEAETLFADNSTTSSYVTPATVADVVSFTQQELAALGWHEYVRPNTASIEDPNNKSLSFIKNGLELSAFISVAPAQDGKTVSQYSVRVLSHELPLLAGASQVEFDPSQPYLRYLASDDAETIKTFYRQELGQQGYEETSDLETLGEDALLFAGPEMALLLSLPQTGENAGKVIIEGLSADEVAGLTAAPETEVEEEPAAETEPALPEGLISAFSIPTPADASVNYEPDLEEISVTSPSDIKTLVAFYREALAALGWQEASDFAIVEENIAVLTFEQGDATLDMNLFNDGFSGETEVTISGSGLAWSDTGVSTLEEETPELEADTPIEAGSSYTINDWPIPEEAQELDIDDDEINYVINWDFVAVTDFYRPIYEAWELSEGCLEPEEGFSSYSCSTGSSNVSVSLNLFENFDDQTEVTFFFSGLAPAEGSAGSGSGEVTLAEEDGLLLPDDFESVSSSSSDFSQETNGTSNAGLEELVALYQSELAAQGWSEEDATPADEAQTSLRFTNAEGSLTVNLSPTAEGTELHVIHKATAAAKEKGILPLAGQARLYLGNLNPEEVTITIDGQTLKISPTDPTAEPEDMSALDLAPGSYPYTLALPGGANFEDTLELGPDQTWTLAIFPDGTFPVQVY